MGAEFRGKGVHVQLGPDMCAGLFRAFSLAEQLQEHRAHASGWSELGRFSLSPFLQHPLTERPRFRCRSILHVVFPVGLASVY